MYYFIINIQKGIKLRVKLGDIATIRTGLVVGRKKAQLDSAHRVAYKQVSLRCFGSSVKLDQTYIDKFVSKEEVAPKYFTSEGDLLVRLRSPNSAVYIEKEDEGLLINSLLSVIRIDKRKIDAKYVAYYINSNTGQRILKLDFQSTAIPMLKTKDLENLEIILPPIEEQRRLVSLLELAQKEQELLLSLAQETQQLSQTILDTIIQHNKEKNNAKNNSRNHQ